VPHFAISTAIVQWWIMKVTPVLLAAPLGTTGDLETFLAKTVKAVAGVERTEPLIVLSSAKETWQVHIPED
jgi:hypothetical protein